MKNIFITREQFEKIKQVFDNYNIKGVLLTEENSSGIGPSTYMEFDPKTTIKQDLTDYETW